MTPQPTRHSLLPDDAPTVPSLTPVLAEGEAIALPPTDETPDPPPTEPPVHIPHLGHALLFIAITGLILLLSQTLLIGTARAAHPADIPPRLLLASMAVTYIATLGLALPLFPLLWKRPFAVGIRWNFPAAQRNLLRLLPLGVVLSVSVQAASNLVHIPGHLPMDTFFRSKSLLWLITLFGIFLAPLFEEILFRGFLLPAIAIAYDWLSLPRTPAAREAWHSSNAISTPAFVFSAILTSVLFALLHGQQTAFTWPILILLFCVSLALTFVRLRLRSVAASTLVHAAYNATIFIAAFVITGGYRHLDHIPT